MSQERILDLGAGFGAGSVSVDTDPKWNYDAVSVDPRGFIVTRLFLAASGSRKVRVQVGLRNFKPTFDMTYIDNSAAPPFDIERTLGDQLIIPGGEVEVRVAGEAATFAGDQFFYSLKLGVKDAPVIASS